MLRGFPDIPPQPLFSHPSLANSQLITKPPMYERGTEESGHEPGGRGQMQ